MTQTTDILEQTRRILMQQPGTHAEAAAVSACCSTSEQDVCCEPSEKSSCCGSDATSSGGCGCR